MHDTAYRRTRSSGVAATAAEAAVPDALRVLGTTRTTPLRRPLFTVGSGRSNDLIINDPFVSKRHCSFRLAAAGLWLQDEASRNGTYVDNIRIERCRVRSGSRITIGKTNLQLLGVPAGAQHGIVGQHETILSVLSQIERYGPMRSPVLILGETGTGKELVARALHEASPGRLATFEPLNCGAIPRGLAEAELFGHAAGAFTGASRERKGAFERADGGTLFLDEVGEMPSDLQPKLLRVLEEGLVQRIGEERRRQVEVRVVAATHRDLQQEAECGRFRMDLYHRLAVGVIELPALRDRREDIPLLVQHFLEHSAGSDQPLQLEPDVLPFLSSRSWPGNVRQLRNALQRATAVAGPILSAQDFAFLDSGTSNCQEDGAVHYRGRLFRDVQREIYQRVLDSCGGNCAAAAAALGVPKSTFFDHVRTMKLRR